MNMKNFLTKGKIEAKISEAVIGFEQEFMGRGPLSAKTYIIEDMVIVRLQGVLTVAELQLISSAPEADGRELVKKMRKTLIENARPVLEKCIEQIVNQKIISMHTDISTKTGERIIIFTFAV